MESKQENIPTKLGEIVGFKVLGAKLGITVGAEETKTANEKNFDNNFSLKKYLYL